MFVSGVGYSVLTHEQLVDLMWKHQIQPLLLKRFPAAMDPGNDPGRSALPPRRDREGYAKL